MTIQYEVMEIIDPTTNKPIGKYKNTRSTKEPGEPPFLFCDHAHDSVEDAKVCLDFEATQLINALKQYSWMARLRGP